MLQWSSLRIICSSRFLNLNNSIKNDRTWKTRQYKRSPLILKNFLDGNHFPRVTELCLVHNTEASIADHLRRMRMMRLWPMFYTLWQHWPYLGVGVGHLRGAVRTLARARNHRHHLAAVLAWNLHPGKVCIVALLRINERCGAGSTGHPVNIHVKL